MKILFLILAILSSLCAKEMSAFAKNIQKYDKAIQKIIKEGSIENFQSDNLNLLKKKLSAKQDLKIKIFGDSHTAPDIFSSELRNDAFEASAVGFVYPLFPSFHRNILTQYESKHFDIYNSLRHSDHDYPMGGVIARAKNEHANIKLDLNLAQKEFSTNFVYMTPSLLAAFEITDNTGKKITLSSKKPNSWEISKVYDLTYPITIHSLIRNAQLGGYFIYKKDNNNIIDHMGINGARSDLWLRWNQEIFDKELQIIQYDLVILSYGSNDAIATKFDPETFMQNYRALIRKIRRYNPNAVILMIAPPTVVAKKDSKYSITANFYPIKHTIREVAQSENTLLFDMDDLMKKTGKKATWIKLGLSKQDVHLTPLGYRTIANAVYKALLETLRLKEN